MWSRRCPNPNPWTRLRYGKEWRTYLVIHRRGLFGVGIDPWTSHPPGWASCSVRPVLQQTHHLELAACDAKGQLLDGKHSFVIGDEDNRVTMDPGRHLHESIVVPVVER